MNHAFVYGALVQSDTSSRTSVAYAGDHFLLPLVLVAIIKMIFCRLPLRINGNCRDHLLWPYILVATAEIIYCGFTY